MILFSYNTYFCKFHRFSFLDNWVTFPCAYMSCSPYPVIIEGQLGWLHSHAIVNRTAEHMGVWVSLLYLGFDSWHTPRRGTTKPCGASSFCAFKETPYGFPCRLNSFTFPSTVHKGSCFPYTLLLPLVQPLYDGLSWGGSFFSSLNRKITPTDF